MRVVIVGGGIVGLATAQLVVREVPDAEVMVLEKEAEVALHQTGHNSGVVHAGVYYPPGSLKAKLCRRGVHLLQQFCAAHEVPYEKCGKVIVASAPPELGALRRLLDRGTENGVPGLRWLDESELLAIEPHAAGLAAVHSPETAIVDFMAVARALQLEIVGRGAIVRTGAAVKRVHAEGDHVRIALRGGNDITAERAVVCAGLHADRLALASGQAAAPRIVPFRGEYWQLRPERSGLVRGLIYPVPDPKLPFLGVHLTRKIDGSVWIGPNAVLSTAREGYSRRTVSFRDIADTVSWPGTARLVRHHWRAGAQEMLRSASKALFLRDARRYVPELRARDVIRAQAGVRAQAVDRDGALVDDFRLSVSDNVVWVRNAPSPAATSSLAIAEELVDRLSFSGVRRLSPG
jgi:L-2-hydroxyglutarate oxidase LhgO